MVCVPAYDGSYYWFAIRYGCRSINMDWQRYSMLPIDDYCCRWFCATARRGARDLNDANRSYATVMISCSPLTTEVDLPTRLNSTLARLKEKQKRIMISLTDKLIWLNATLHWWIMVNERFDWMLFTPQNNRGFPSSRLPFQCRFLLNKTVRIHERPLLPERVPLTSYLCRFKCHYFSSIGVQWQRNGIHRHLFWLRRPPKGWPRLSRYATRATQHNTRI